MGQANTKPFRNSDRSTVSIIGLHKAKVLHALYDGALYLAPKFDVQPAIRESATQRETTPVVKQILANQLIKEKSQTSDHPCYRFKTIDLGNGPRELDMDLTSYEVDVSAYNALHGEGIAQTIISNLYNNTHQVTQKHVREEEKACVINPGNALFEYKRYKKSDNQPEKEIYLVSLQMLDPKLDRTMKEVICHQLVDRYQSQKGRNLSIAGTLSYLPHSISVPILLYAPTQVLTDFYDYQMKFSEYTHDLCDKNFETTLMYLASHDAIPLEEKTLFLNKIDTVFRQRMQEYHYQGDLNHTLFEAMASWEKNSLMPLIYRYFDKELKLKYDQFNAKLHQSIENSSPESGLGSEFGSLVFENILVRHNFNAETLTSIVKHFTHDEDTRRLALIYTLHGLDPAEMFKQHLIQLAKLSDVKDYSALFVTACLAYLKEEAKSIAPQIASVLSVEYYASNTWAFSSIRKELFTYWMDVKPEQIIGIVKALLNMPKDTHHSAIREFFSNLSYAELPDSFYDALAMLMHKHLTSSEFIRVYTEADDVMQLKLLSAKISDENQALENLMELNTAYQNEKYSVVFLRKIASQLQMLNPNLYQQKEITSLFPTEQITDTLETDLSLLKKLLENESLTHHERRSEIHRLTHLHKALNDEKTNACPVVMKMFNQVPKTHWPELFVYFDAEINHWSFPQDEEHLKLFYPNVEDRPPPRKNTWVVFQSEWKNILTGTLVAILKNMSTQGANDSTVQWALTAIDNAFSQTSIYIPDIIESLLKDFFLENLPNSIMIFQRFHDEFNDKYHLPQYFSKKGIYNQVASWLPEDRDRRSMLLAQWVRNNKFEAALKSPFVKDKNDFGMLAFSVIHFSKEHMINLFDRLPRTIVDRLFKIMHERDKKGFLKLLEKCFLGLSESANLTDTSYLYYARMLLSYSKNAGVDIFQVIDKDPKKALLLQRMSDVKIWENEDMSIPYDLIFSILHHYKPDEFQKFIFEHIQMHIKKNSNYLLYNCIKAVHEETGQSLVLPEAEMNILVGYLTEQMSKIDDYEIKAFARYIPNYEKYLLETIAKSTKGLDKLPSRHERSLDALVGYYGFDPILKVCCDLNMTSACLYLTEKFGKFPDILDKIDAVMKPYYDLFDAHSYLLEDDLPQWRFFEKLRSAIFDAAKEQSKIYIDVHEIGEKSEVPPELIQRMPPLVIKSKIHEENGLSLSQSWIKSGLIASPSSSKDSKTDDEIMEAAPTAKL